MVVKRNNGASGKSGPPKGRALVPAKGREIAPLVQADGSVVERDGPATLVTGRAYAAADLVVPADAIYTVDGLKPYRDGPWLGEADKVAWRDPASGLECIMMRAKEGNLCGYVGVPRSHPLHGWAHEAIPAELGIEVHGGITYSRICDEGPTPERRIGEEARRICHVATSPPVYEPTQHATDHRPGDAHAWWLGFECDGAYDLLPGDRRRTERAAAAGIGLVYRDDAYVLREVLDLAAQLRAIGDGALVPPRSGPPLPPIGPDPKRRG